MNTTAPSKNIRSHFLATLCVLILTCALLACDSHGVAVTIVSVDTGSRSLQNALSVALTGGSPVVNGDGAAVQIGYYQGATVANKFGNGDDCNFVTLIGAGNVLGLNLTVGDTAANGAGNGQIFADSNVSGRGSGGLTDPLFPPAGTPLVVRFFSATTVSGSQHFEAISNNSWLWINPVNGPPSMVFINFDDPGLVSKSGANVSAPGSSIRTIISYTCPSDPFIANPLARVVRVRCVERARPPRRQHPRPGPATCRRCYGQATRPLLPLRPRSDG